MHTFELICNLSPVAYEYLHNNLPIDEYEQIQCTVRIEAQLEKRGIYNMKLPTKRAIKPFLEKEFCHEYLERELKNIFGVQKYVSRRKAVEIINNSPYKPYHKAVMLFIIDTIPRFQGLYELEKAITAQNINTPIQYGNLLKKTINKGNGIADIRCDERNNKSIGG